MSHFSVIVIGENVKEQLAPYHEFECTGIDEHVQDIDITEEARESWKESDEESFVDHIQNYYGRSSVSFGEQPELTGAHKFGFALLNAQGEVQKVIKRTNPNATWDWYVQGGRWSNWIKDKNGEYRDQLRVSELGIELMQEEVAQKSAALYDRVHLIAGEPWEPWASVRARLPLEQTRDFFHAQPAIKRLRADKDFCWGIEDEWTTLSREQYIEYRKEKVCIPYAWVEKGQWHGKGEMGWFGASMNERPEKDYNKEFMDKLHSLSGDTLLTVIDCHI